MKIFFNQRFMSETTSNEIGTNVPQNAQDQVPSSYPEQKTSALDNISVISVLENIKKIPPNYREGYGKREVKEDGTPMVDIRTYNLE